MAGRMRVLRTLTAGALLAAGACASSGCVLVHPRPARPAATADCPPGHRWSDGRCHARGKGHDPGKRHGKKPKRR